MNTPNEDAVPDGFQVITDDDFVKEGDVVLDYCTAGGFAQIKASDIYHRLIGKTGHEARLDQLAFEVFKRAPNESN